MCGEKQSVLRVSNEWVFAQGSGFDCRCHVQKLNLLQGEVEQAPVNMLWHAEGPGERGDENTVVTLEENVDWQRRRGSVIADTKSCGDTTCKNLIKPAAEELLVHGVNEEPRSRGAVLSKWEKFLLSDECDNSSGMPASLQERLETPVKTPIVPATDGMAASFIGITPSNWGPEPKQYAPNMLVCTPNTERVGVTSLPTSKSRDTPVLASSLKESLLNMLPEAPASVPSSSPLAASNVKNLYRSFFSTGDDFDDYL
ncbi:hypothetical protein lerEdw1_016206 [Lerista edwardsae]|nr:hypothetical protein lerEdw1_016206 [Lerista edwardsae]